MRNIDGERHLKEAWDLHYDKEYNELLKMYKSQGYKVRRNDKTGEHIVEKKDDKMFIGTPFENFFK